LIAEIAQQHVAAAGLAESRIHRLLVDDRGLLAGEPRGAENACELVAHGRYAFGRRGREIGEDVVDVDGVGQVAGGIGRRVAGIDQDDRLARDQVGKLGGGNEDFLTHG